MVNMYSMGSMGSMNSMGMNNSFGSGNVFQNFKAKYGVGYEDFGYKPYITPYPMPISPPDPVTFSDKNWLCRFIKKCFN